MQRSQRPRRRWWARPLAEGLETRLALTGGGGDIFAVIPAQITTPGGSATIPITIDPGHFTAPHGSLVLAIDVSGRGTPGPTPEIRSVADARGHKLPIVHGTYGAALSKKLGGKTETSAVLVTLPVASLRHGKPASFTVTVGAAGKTSGTVTAGFFLPGDAQGTGVVTQKGIEAIQAAQGAQFGDAKYSINADANRDGRIDRSDLRIARQNLGVMVTITPTLTGQPDAASAVDPRTLKTSVQDLGFTGKASPGATIVASPINGHAAKVTTTAAADGAYHLVIHLSPGLNSFSVSETDAFGQTNGGVLPGITYVPKGTA